jgi:hypothetical protein
MTDWDVGAAANCTGCVGEAAPTGAAATVAAAAGSGSGNANRNESPSVGTATAGSFDFWNELGVALLAIVPAPVTGTVVRGLSLSKADPALGVPQLNPSLLVSCVAVGGLLVLPGAVPGATELCITGSGSPG